MNVKDLIEEAISLPREERTLVIESLLQSLDGSDPAVDAEWLAVAKQRFAEIDAGQVELVDADEVFASIRARHAQ